MRLLALADLHGNLQALRDIAAAVPADDVDLVLFAGDLTHFGPVSEVGDITRTLTPRSFLGVPGNCDPRDIPEALEAVGADLHGRAATIDGVTFAGVGGGPPSHFGTPTELGDQEMATMLTGAVGAPSPGPLVLLTHAPPRGTSAALTPAGQDIGSGGVREAVLGLSPSLLVCGHVHEARGRHILEGTSIVNPGPARQRYYALIALAEEGEVAEVRLAHA